MTKQTITIGIPAFNEEANIQNVIQSIKNQTSGDFEILEIIVISDHSTDKTYHEVIEMGDSMIKVSENAKRIGQNATQNLMIEMMSEASTCLLLLEADILLDKNYIAELVSVTPEDDNFSIVYGDSKALYSDNFVGRSVFHGFNFRKELFENTRKEVNLYNFSGCGLYSRKFLKKFRWDSQFHDDSYAFRRAIESGYPMIRCKKAYGYLRLVDNVHDYLLQSIKYQKASSVESRHSVIYKLDISPKVFMHIVLKHLLAHPLSFFSYILLAMLSRTIVHFAPAYTPFWATYQSSKELAHKGVFNNGNTMYE